MVALALHHHRHIARLFPAKDWLMPAHSHADSHELVMVVEGAVETVMDGRTTVAEAGVIKFHPRGVPHAERQVSKSRTVLLCMAWREAEGYDYSHWPQLVSDRTGRIRQLLEWMVELSPAHDPNTQLALDSMLQAVAFAFAGSGASEHDDLVLRVRAWVRENLTQAIYLDDLARVAGMSRFHFNRVFTRASGRSPMRFVRELRADAARALLLNTTMPLREIAPQVGFTDEFQLSRVFRQVTGQSPAKLRRRG
jgi:AraC-like DNA-binding protein/mannose-6-phosphate isomerase-like protein (cupin superfamily)